MTTVAIIQARMGSTRLPGKIMADLEGMPLLGWTVRAARAVPGVDSVLVATSDATPDDVVEAWCRDNSVQCYRGSANDVLRRYAEAATEAGSRRVVRLTADCPFLDPAVVGMTLRIHESSGCNYASNVDPATWPDGLDCEVFDYDALMMAAAEATLESDREHVTPFIRRHADRFTRQALRCPLPDVAMQRWTVDTEADLTFVRQVAARLTTVQRPPSFLEVLAVLDKHPELKLLNAGEQRNEGLAKSRKADRAEITDFTRSNQLLDRAERTIPIGSQTFSKSRIQFPLNAAPMFATRGYGGRIIDVDGNEYVDLVAALLPVVLGYRDPDVDAAIVAQLESGISLSLATALEAELAERLVEIIPCAEKVRFGKNGSDATSAAVRLSRAFTGRERIAVCGYHGWQDWYIGSTTRNKGVPSAVRELTHRVAYNDLSEVERLLKQFPGEIAALVMEPMNIVEPAPGYLRDLKALLHAHGALLVFDEVITGFRFALGGAQQLFGVSPDLAAFGKAMGNGMPISAIVGRADVMREMEDIFFSGTFGGETLSLAASIAVIDKMKREPVIEQLWKTGERLAAGAEAILAREGLDDAIRLVGQAPWKILDIRDRGAIPAKVIKTRFIRNMVRHGVLLNAGHNVCYAHSDNDIDTVLSAYEATASDLRTAFSRGDLTSDLGCEVIEPVFKVR